MPTLADRLRLWLWCVLTFLSAGSAFLYLPMSAEAEFEQLSEHPEPLTLLFWVCTLASTALWATASGRAWRAVRPVMKTGVVAGWLMTGFYSFYVYHLSSTLDPGDRAAEVGELAPDFAVTDPRGRTWTLSEFRGRTVLLVFYRGDW